MNTKHILALTTLTILLTTATTANTTPELQQEIDQATPNDRIEVILTVGPQINQSHIDNAAQQGEIQKTYEQFNNIHLELPTAAVENLEQRDFVEKIEPNYETSTTLQESTTQIEAETAWNNNATGEDINVAVLDTGIQANHPNLNIAEEIDFTGEGTQDDDGHGTHVAGIIASQHEDNRGVAYQSTLNDVKVLGADGSGSGTDLLDGIEWTIENDIDIAVMSLGATVDQCDGEDFLSQAVDEAFQNGVFVTVAAGNEGPEEQSITIPGCSQEALTVGSVDKNNEIASYSSRGPTADNQVKPDVVAPGTNIESTYNNEDFQTLTGTSMATPHVAGQAANILQQNPDTTNEELKNQITQTTVDLGLDENTQGTGRINISATTNTTQQEQEEEENETTIQTQTEITTPETETTQPLNETLQVQWNATNQEENTTLLNQTTVQLSDYLEQNINQDLELEPGQQQNLQTEIQSDQLEEAENQQLTVTDTWENNTETQDTVTINIENQTQQEQEEDEEETSDGNQTEENRTQTGPPTDAGDPSQQGREARQRSPVFGPSSRLYSVRTGLDRIQVATGLKTREEVMEERAREAREMQEEGNNQAAERAVNELGRSAGEDENSTTRAEETLNRVIEDAPEEAQEGLRNALSNVEENREQRRQAAQPGESQGQGRDEAPGQDQQPGQGQDQDQGQEAPGQSQGQSGEAGEAPGQQPGQGNETSEQPGQDQQTPGQAESPQGNQTPGQGQQEQEEDDDEQPGQGQEQGQEGQPGQGQPEEEEEEVNGTSEQQQEENNQTGQQQGPPQQQGQGDQTTPQGNTEQNQNDTENNTTADNQETQENQGNQGNQEPQGNTNSNPGQGNAPASFYQQATDLLRVNQ